MRRINSLLQVYHIALKKKKKQQQLYTMIQLQKTRMHIFQYTGTIKMCTLNFRVAILPRVCFSLHDASDGRYMRFFQGCCTSLFSVYIKSCMLVIYMQEEKVSRRASSFAVVSWSKGRLVRDKYNVCRDVCCVLL